MPCMKFLFVRPDVCRRLPSDSTSRWTPLPWAMRFPLLGLARDLHPLANAHAERTTERRCVEIVQHTFFLFRVIFPHRIPRGRDPASSWSGEASPLRRFFRYLIRGGAGRHPPPFFVRSARARSNGWKSWVQEVAPSTQPEARVSAARRNLEEAGGKHLVWRTETSYKAYARG